jgi:outer membrane protein
MSSAAKAADLPTVKEPIFVAPAAADYQPYFVKVDAAFLINTSESRLYGPLASRVIVGDLSPYPQHIGATIGNIVTGAFAAGVFVNPNVSFNIASGIPVYTSVKTKGFYPLNPPLINGTVLGQGLLSLVPMTVVYHFNQFGPFQPYLGVGITPVFSLGNKNAFLTGINVESTVGGVFQAGADYMFDRHWGVSVDAKKIIAYAESTASGVALLPGVYAYSTFHTNYQPWVLSAGIVYRFGGPEAAPVLAKY